MQEHWELIIGAIAVGAGVWSYLKSFFHWLAGFVISVRRLEFETAGLILSYLGRGRRMTREPAYSSSTVWFIKPLGRTGRVVYRMLAWSGTQVFWWRGRPIRYIRHNDENNSMGGCEQVFSFLRGTVDWEGLLLEAADWENSSEQTRVGRHKVKYHYGKSFGTELAEATSKAPKGHRNGSDAGWDKFGGLELLRWTPEDIGGAACPMGIGDLALSEDLLGVTREIKFWHESQDWYSEHRIPWRRGFIFHGAPGTGKTSLTRAMAETLDLPVHVFDLASMSNDDLRRSWTSMAGDSPCLALIEDIDAVFNGRENVAKSGGMMSSGGLTFDCLLNCIDGIERSNGILLVITTNVQTAIDPALFDRPGRVDRVIEFLPLDLDGRLKLARQILGNVPEADRIAHESDGITAAQLQENCCRKAIEQRFANGK